MAPKKNVVNGFSLFMSETKQTLAKNGIKMNMADMPNYCQKDWESMPTERKDDYKLKAKMMKKKYSVGGLTSIGESVEDIRKQMLKNKSQSDAMYLYIEELVRVKPAYHYLPRHKFILIHVNSYTCVKEEFYFPAEISMAEFSLEKGLLRIFHRLIGFDPIKTKAPGATAADINCHAKCNHQIGPYVKLSCHYMEILLKVIGFIIDKDVDEDVFNDPYLDIPPIYTAHTPNRKELMITNLSLFYLYKSVVQYATRDDFNRLLSVYHLDKLFMEMKNVAYEIRHPKINEKALPSVAMATDSLTRDLITTDPNIGCSYHEKLGYSHVCSNYYVCKWIFILSTHCCQYFNIKLEPGCHYDFDLSIKETPVEKAIDNLNIAKADVFNNISNKRQHALTTNNDSSVESNPTTNQQTTANRPECHNIDTLKEIRSTQGQAFSPFDNPQNCAHNSSHVAGMNNQSSNANTRTMFPDSFSTDKRTIKFKKNTSPFGNSKKFIVDSCPVDEASSWRSNKRSNRVKDDTN